MHSDLLTFRAGREAARLWWLFLITGVIWFIVSLVIFRFDATSATAIGVLIGVVLLVIGGLELASSALLEGGWKVFSMILGVAFIIGGFAALVYPDKTFVAVASIFAWVLLFKGAYDIIIAIATKDETELWWFRLIVGILEIALAFWAASGVGRSAALLVIFVGALALFRGITDIFTAFQLRQVGKDMDESGPPPAPAGARQVESPY